MKPKSIVTALLLAYVGVSVVYLIASEIGVRPAPPQVAPTSQPADGVTVYYFLDNDRCETCLKIERYTHEVLSSGFASELAEGRLHWRPVNTDEPAHAHFKQDYRLATKSVVLVAARGGRQVRWKNLDRIWELIFEKDEFQRYVADEVRAFSGGR